MSNWIDISQSLTNEIAQFPGDTPFSYSPTFTKEETGPANIGQMTTSLHIGTHIDAPFHYDSAGKTVEQLDLDLYIGKAIVIDVSHTDKITAAVLQEFEWENVPRVLLRTSLPNNPKHFPDQIPNLDPDIAAFLQEKGVALLGVDIPSVDAPDSKELETHHALYRNGINILENIMLDRVEEGLYELVALPLAIHGADGSPVRAVLRPINEENES
ncbi:arylformamidase [Virgibacillus sp. NKC19-16]|uniref:arylformamidase n=1 Tax=Virgibacillus salidurans TaxID=2831673 RepID=UPI001F3978BD|nr:arylformamidase [Virgibacillus sp. NKC19-16]UJL47282.1 arylformamidase [Virgibacillus sp. NKC19-16]